MKIIILRVEAVLWCEAQDSVVTTFVWHVWECHKRPIFHHWWPLDQIWVRWCRENNDKHAVTFCFLLTSDSVWRTQLLNLCAFHMWRRRKSNFFIRNLEVFSKLTTGLAVVFLYGPLQDLIILDLWPANAGFIIKEQISLPEPLEPMLVVCSLTELPPKSWRIWLFDAATDKHTLKS